MRLLDTRTGRFKSFEDPRTVHYAILSHVWSKGKVPEQTFQEIDALVGQSHESESVLHLLHPKIQNACEIAHKHAFDYLWTDAGCIDRSSSAELSQAINSMFDWYRHASVCYAYLDDVEDPRPGPGGGDATCETWLALQFCFSRWFKRGWTLQELLAPRHVLFLSKGWKVVGTKNELAAVIEKETLIDRRILTGDVALEDVSVATRMAWAAKRETTLEEDEAYCLLGIFGVHIAPMYGEGRYAFIRLQEAILRQSADPTILAWGLTVPMGDELVFDKPDGARHEEQRDEFVSDDPKSYLFALSPNNFEYSGRVQLCHQPLLPDYDVLHTVFTPTAHGVRTCLPLLQVFQKDGTEYLLALLGCKDRDGRRVALLLRQPRPWASLLSVTIGAYLRDEGAGGRTGRSSMSMQDAKKYYRLVGLDEQTVEAHKARFHMREICIPHCLPPGLRSQVRDRSIHKSLMCHAETGIELELAGWCAPLLDARGYAITRVQREPDTASPPAVHSFLLREHADFSHVTGIQVGHCMRKECREDGCLSAFVSFPTRALTMSSAAGDPAAGAGERTACELDHIRSWDPQNCVASKDFAFLSSSGFSQRLRLTFRLRSSLGKRTYVLEIELLDLDLSSSLVAAREERRRSSQRRDTRGSAKRPRANTLPSAHVLRAVPEERGSTSSDDDLSEREPVAKRRKHADHEGSQASRAAYRPPQMRHMTEVPSHAARWPSTASTAGPSSVPVNQRLMPNGSAPPSLAAEEVESTPSSRAVVRRGSSTGSSPLRRRFQSVGL